MVDRGKFIVIEGPDAVGKSEVMRRLWSRFTARNGPGCRFTREPTDGPIGKLIRQALRHEVTLAPGAMGPLYAADRADHAATVLEPALARGEIVVCDRYLLSNLVYRGAEHPSMRCTEWHCDWEGDDTGRCHRCNSVWIAAHRRRQDAIDWARTLSRGAPRPDVTIVLTAPLEVCAARRRARGGAAELYDDAILQARVHALYADAARLLPGERVAMVDANGSAEEVEQRVWAAAAEVLHG